MNETEFQVDITPFIDGAFADHHFTINVTARDLAQAERRALRRAVANAGEWNARNPLAAVPRRTQSQAYRAIAARRVGDTTPAEPKLVFVGVGLV